MSLQSNQQASKQQQQQIKMAVISLQQQITHVKLITVRYYWKTTVVWIYNGLKHTGTFTKT